MYKNFSLILFFSEIEPVFEETLFKDENENLLKLFKIDAINPSMLRF